MKIKNLKVTITAVALGGVLFCVKAFNNYNDEFNQHCTEIGMDLDEINDNIDEIGKMAIQHHEYLERLKEDSSQIGKEKTVEEEVEELLKESPEYREISEYVSEITYEDMESFQNSVLGYYDITSKSNIFRFDPNNFSEAKARIEAYAKQMDSLENQTYATKCFVNVTDDDSLVEKYRNEYQENHLEASEEELQEAEKNFREKAAAVYYTKMNYKYLSDETLRKINEIYQFVEDAEDSEKFEMDILNYVSPACIVYHKTPLLKEMVANMGDYTAHSLLDQNTNTKRWLSLIGDNEEVVKRVIHGDFGNGEERKEKLGKEGYNYYAVQEAVNQELGVVTNKKSTLYRLENGEIVSNLPVLPTDKDALCKYALIEKNFQKQYLENTVIYSDYDTYHAPFFYHPQMVLINQVVSGHMEEIYYMLMEEGNTGSVENKILYEIELHSPLDFFEIVEEVQETVENKKKIYE